MLYGIEFLRSVAVAFAGLVHVALMSICSRRASSSSSALQLQVIPPARTIKKARPVMAVSVSALVDEKQMATEQILPLLPPPAVGFTRADQEITTKPKATKGRPTRLVIPPPAVSAGVNPFGAAAAAATQIEAEGEGFCVATRRGVRHAMEDGYDVIADKAFYGVYDGHGGRAAVDLVADKLGHNILAALTATATTSSTTVSLQQQQQQDDGGGVMAAIRAGYLITDTEFLSQGGRGGACAATALVKDGELYVANLGDCRAVLGSRGGGVATALTSDHTPGRDDERLRIEGAGGYVSRGSGGVWRVQDCLAVSRAFGDADMRPWVSGEPELSRHRLTPDCAFLVLASDGLWSKVSNQEAVTTAGAGGVSMADSCKELITMAKSRGSRDDITVMLVDLRRFIDPHHRFITK